MLWGTHHPSKQTTSTAAGSPGRRSSLRSSCWSSVARGFRSPCTSRLAVARRRGRKPSLRQTERLPRCPATGRRCRLRATGGPLAPAGGRSGGWTGSVGDSGSPIPSRPRPRRDFRPAPVRFPSSPAGHRRSPVPSGFDVTTLSPIEVEADDASRDAWRRSVRIGGQAYDRAVCLRPAEDQGTTQIAFDIDARFARLRGVAGIADASSPSPAGAAQDRPQAVFRVYGDGNLLWESGPLAGRGDHRAFECTVAGVDVLTFVAESQSPANISDLAWSDLKLFSNTQPRAQRNPIRRRRREGPALAVFRIAAPSEARLFKKPGFSLPACGPPQSYSRQDPRREHLS